MIKKSKSKEWEPCLKGEKKPNKDQIERKFQPNR